MGWEQDVLNVLASLVDKSLVIADEQDGVVRYRLLETVRQYAVEKLEEAGETAAARNRHLAWCLALAEATRVALQGPGGYEQLARLEQEHDNLRAALAWSLGQREGEPALRLAGALTRFWELRGHLSEGRQWLARALEAGQGVAAVRAAALLGAATLAYVQGDLPAARALAKESLILNQDIGNRWGIADAHYRIGSVTLRCGDHAAARTLLETSLAVYTELGFEPGIAGANNALGMLTLRQGDYDAARDYFEASLTLYRKLGDKDGIAATLDDLATVVGEQHPDAHQMALLEESLALYREIGKRQGVALVLGSLGATAWARGDLDRAQTLLEESLALYREVGDRRGIARLLAQQALVALYQRDYTRAAALGRESLTLHRDLDDPWAIARYLPVLAGVAFGQGQLERAACLFGAAAGLRGRLGASLPPVVRNPHDRTVAAVRASLGEPVFAAARARGEAMRSDEVIAYALTEAG